LLSPDEDFSPIGNPSSINYAESFKVYKTMLTQDPDSPVFKRIFSKFNISLFGVEPTVSNDLIADDGDYESELEEFRRGLLADPLIEDVADAGVSLPPTPPIQLDRRVSTPAANAGADETSPFSGSLLASPHQPGHEVSVSVTSHISHTIAASSQVSNIVSSSIALSPEREVSKASPPIQEKARPAPKPKGVKSLTLAAATSDTNADAAPTQKKRTTRPAKTAPADPPARTLRRR
jgi:hypothetical protein